MPGSKLMLANSENASDFENQFCEWEKYPLTNVCELESSMSPNKGKEFASGLTSLLEEKNNVSSKTLQVQ